MQSRVISDGNTASGQVKYSHPKRKPKRKPKREEEKKKKERKKQKLEEPQSIDCYRSRTAWDKSVKPDPVVREPAREQGRELLRHVHRRGLAARVVEARPGAARERGRRGRRDDLARLGDVAPPVAGVEERQEGDGAVVHGADVGGQRAAEPLRVDVPQAPVDHVDGLVPEAARGQRAADDVSDDACVGDEEVDVADFFCYPLRDALQVWLGRYVSLDGDDVIVKLSGTELFSLSRLGRSIGRALGEDRWSPTPPLPPPTAYRVLFDCPLQDFLAAADDVNPGPVRFESFCHHQANAFAGCPLAPRTCHVNAVRLTCTATGDDRNEAPDMKQLGC